MHPLLKTLMIVVVLGGAGTAGLMWYQSSSSEQAYQTELNTLQQQWTERLSAIRGVEDPGQYEEEIRTLLRWYFSSLQDLHNRFPDQNDPDRAWREIEEDHRAGRIPSDRLEDYREFFEYVKGVYETLRDGKYTSGVTGTAKNLRLDFYDVKRDTFETAPRLRLDFVLWGAPRRFEERTSGGKTVKKVRVPVSFERMFFQFIDEAGKVHSEMAGSSGEPFRKVEYPERWIAEFPPQAVLGTYWVELFPSEAKRVAWEMNLGGRTDAGNPIDASYRWELDIPSGWKTSGDWGGTEQVRPEEYINRTAAEN